MLNFYAFPFYNATYGLQVLEERIRRLIEQRGGDSFPTKDETQEIRDVIVDLDRECRRIHAERALERLARLNNLTDSTSATHFDKLSWELNDLRICIRKDLAGKQFFYVPRHLADYYYDPSRTRTDREIFGELVHKNFPSAVEDIREAGNCYATGNNTACVFHLMRVLEHGLRSLARKVRIKAPPPPTPPKKPRKRRPVDLEEWKGLIDRLEEKIRDIERQRKTPQRQVKLQFYHGAAAQFRHFKNAWRNHVMHSHESYDRHDAAKVMEHTREFMQHLAESGLSEE
jgi:hypothetical protein